jgi:Flp pilus assembly protein TadG
MVPFVLLLGVAVDVGQLLIVKNQLQSAIDAAALDIGTNPSLTTAQAQTQAQNYVNANFSTQYSSATLTSLSVTQNNTASPPIVSITATATINTVFLPIVGKSTLSTTVSTQVTIAQNHLEVVLVLDNTGSMLQSYGGMTGIQGLISASTTLVNTLFASDPTGQYVKIAVVPFTDNVNVANSLFGVSTSSPPSWIDNSNASGSLSQENIGVPTGTGLITFAGQLAKATGQSSWAWQGCVRQRTEPYDTTDIAPSSGATLYTPFFAPDEPDCCTFDSNKNFYNNYLKDGQYQTVNRQQQVAEYSYNSTTKTCSSTTNTYPYSSTTVESNEQYCANKYTSSPSVQSNGYGPNALCTVQPIIPLTNSQTDIINEINAMQAYGATVIPAGLTWGWHLISPNVSSVVFPNNAAVAYTNNNTIKVIILLTDGYNDVQLSQLGVPPATTTNGFNQSVYSAYGYAAAGNHLNLLPLPASLNGVQDQPDYNLDQKEIQLCNNIKAVTDTNGNPGRIQIYAIGFGNVINNSSLQLLQQCATDSAHYFYNPTSEELITTFQNIAIGLSKLRISQ